MIKLTRFSIHIEYIIIYTSTPPSEIIIFIAQMIFDTSIVWIIIVIEIVKFIFYSNVAYEV